MMKNRQKLIDCIELELDKIAESGVMNSTKLDQAYKLVDILKDMKNMEYWDVKEDYYDTVQDGMEEYSRADGHSRTDGYSRRDYDRGSSYRRRRDGMGRYSRTGDPVDAYRDSKMDYRRSGSPESKQQMMDNLKRMLSDMARDSDFAEEREVIMNFKDMLNM